MELTRSEVEKLFRQAREHVIITCDENHGHDARCIGPKAGQEQVWVSVCQLAETIQALDHRLRAVKGLEP